VEEETTGTAETTGTDPTPTDAGEETPAEASTERAGLPADVPPWAVTSHWDIPAEALAALLRFLSGVGSEHYTADGGQHTGPDQGYKVQDGIAVLSVRGAMVNARLPRWLLRWGRITSMPNLEADFAACLDDPSVRAVMFHIDSPGGQVAGLADLCELVHAADKPVFGHVVGQCTSAAYELAAACDRITGSSRCLVGGLGAMLTIREWRMEGERVLKMVSRQTPRKDLSQALENTKKGRQARADIQAMLDQMAAEMFDALARYGRDVGDAKDGRMLVGEQAVEAGLIDDGLMTFSEAMAKAVAKVRRPTMEPNEQAVADARAEATKLERERVAAILALPGPDNVKQEAISEGLSVGDAAVKILQAEPEPEETGAEAELRARQEAESGDHPSSGQGADAGDDKAKMAAAAKETVEAMQAAGVSPFLGTTELMAGANQLPN